MDLVFLQLFAPSYVYRFENKRWLPNVEEAKLVASGCDYDGLCKLLIKFSTLNLFSLSAHWFKKHHTLVRSQIPYASCPIFRGGEQTII